MRICIIALPRTGSQHLAEIFRQAYKNMTDCYEPFTHSEFLYDLELKNNKIIIVKNKKYVDIQDRITSVCNIIDRSDQTQNLVLRLFLLDYLEQYYTQIFSCLKRNQFVFYVLRRDNTEQLLSWAIAVASAKWNTNRGYHANNKYLINDFSSMTWLYKQINEFDKRLGTINCGYNEIHYETIYQDVYKNLAFEPNLKNLIFKKQIINDHYDYIINADEVREVIENIKNGKIY